ncbi:hypothetical protein MKW92_014420 [Papaver armeniacum]|nr:hypothetical protein MKW92_014420 [Papaver armeniacum]
MRRRLEETREKEILEQQEEEDDEEEEEQICRICHSPGDSKNPLKYPCACSGSIRFVHSKCLLRWMKQSITLKCEVCDHKYSMGRVYAENTPTRLPLREFVGGIPKKACHVVPFYVRICVSVLNQLLVLPYIAFWIWRLSLENTFFEAKELLVYCHMSPSTFMMRDWLYALVIGNIVLILIMWLCCFAEDWFEIAIPPQPGNRNHNADEIGEAAGMERQDTAGVRDADLVELLLTVLMALLRYFRELIISVFRLAVHDPVRRTCIYLATCFLYFTLSNNVQQTLVVVRFLGRIIPLCLSRLFFAASSIFTPFIKSALYIENNSLKNASLVITNLSAEIQNDGLISGAIEVVAETFTADSTGPGEDLKSVGIPLLVYQISGLYDVITLATGYMIAVPLILIPLGVPRRNIASKLRYRLRKLLTTMINPFFLIIHLGVLPLVYGWWLDVCTITVLGRSISDRVEFFSEFPLFSALMHWAIGIMYLFQIHISTSHVQRVPRNEVLYFFHDLAEPIHIILRGLTSDVRVQDSKFLFSIAVNGILMVCLVYLPVILTMRLASTIFPLHISVSDPFTEIPAVMLLLQICLHYAIELRETVEALLRKWVTAVCCVLSLVGFLCSRPEDIGGQENVKVERQQDRLHDGLIAAQDPNKNIFIPIGSTFVLRVVLFVLLAWIMFLLWIMLLLFVSSLIIVSLPVGRVLLSSISHLPITHGIKCNDLYAFFIGNVSIWTSFTGARYFIEHFKAGKGHLHICKSFCIIVRGSVLLSLWIIVIPLLIGLLLEFSFMVPIRALVVEAPVLVLCQDWAVGFIIFKLWRTLVVLNHGSVLVDESWRIKIERVRENDVLKLPRRWMVQEILIPIIMNLLMFLCPPYFARWIVPSLGFPVTANSTVDLLTWVAYVTIIVLSSCAKIFPVWISKLHNSIRDDRYSGFGLQNFGEAGADCENETGKLARWLRESRGR